MRSLGSLRAAAEGRRGRAAGGRGRQGGARPTRHPSEQTKGPYRWSNPEAIDREILAKGKRLGVTQLPADKEFSAEHSFRFQADPGRFLYVRVKKGVPAFGGYLLAEDHQTILEVPAFPRQVKLLHGGSLLALSGKRQVSVFARDVPGLRFEIGRVLPEQTHHVFAFSGGPVSRPSLQYPVTQEYLAEIEVDTRAVEAPPGKPVYEILDLAKYLDRPASGEAGSARRSQSQSAGGFGNPPGVPITGGERRGLFFVKVESWNLESQQTMGESDSRLVMVSDLGVLSKKTTDGAHDVFVQSIQTGKPVGGTRVQVIGKNGQPVLSQSTDGEGHAHLPSLRELRQEKTPVLFLVSSGRDSSFLPYGRHDRMLDLSRFDVGGVSESERNEGLSGYLFSERGLYRPGDEIHLGVLVRSRDLGQRLEGLPLELVASDARGMEVKRERFKLGPAGLDEFGYRTREESPTGNYTFALYTVKDGQAEGQIGSTTVTVREFLPDRMLIHSSRCARTSRCRANRWSSRRPARGASCRPTSRATSCCRSRRRRARWCRKSVS